MPLWKQQRQRLRLRREREFMDLDSDSAVLVRQRKLRKSAEQLRNVLKGGRGSRILREPVFFCGGKIRIRLRFVLE